MFFGGGLTGGGPGGGFLSAGVSTGGNTLGTTGLASNQAVFVGGANITLSQSRDAGGGSVTVTIVGGAGAGGFDGGITSLGNTAGTSGTVGKEIVFVGGSNITISASQDIGGNSATLTFNAAAGGVPIATAVSSVLSANSVGTITRYAPEDHAHAGVFAAGVSTGGNTLGNTTVFPGGFVFAGINNITLSQVTAAGNNATITISGPTTVAQTAQTGISSIAASNTTYTSGQVIFVGSNIVTVKSAAGQSVVIDATVAAQSAQTGISGIAGSAASTVTAGTVQFANANSMSFGLNGSTMTGSFSVTNTAPPIGTAVKAVGGVASIGTITRFSPEDHVHVGVAGINASGTASTFVGSLMLSGTNLTLVTGGVSNAGSLGFSVAAQTSGAQSHGMSNLGNTSGTTGMASGNLVQMVYVGSNNITLSQSINGASGTITWLGVTSASLVPADIVSSVSSANASGTQHSWFARGDHIHAGVGPAGVSTGGNTLGTTGVQHGQLVFAGGANVTLSQSVDASNRMTITVSAGSAAASPVNFSAGTTSNNLGSVVFSNSNGVSFGLNGSTITGSVAAEVSETLIYHYCFPASFGSVAPGVNSLYLQPEYMPGYFSAGSIEPQLSQASTSATVASHSKTIQVAIYTRNGSSISLASSSASNWTFQGNVANNLTLFSGIRMWPVPITWNITPGNYWLGFHFSSTGTMAHSVYQDALASINDAALATGIAGSATSSGMIGPYGLGVYSATTAAFPNAIAFTDIRSSAVDALGKRAFQMRAFAL